MAGIYDGIKQPPTNSDRPEAMIPYPPLRPVHSPSYDAATATRDRDAPHIVIPMYMPIHHRTGVEAAELHKDPNHVLLLKQAC